MIGEDGRMSAEAGERFEGLLADEAREAVVAALREEGRLRDEQPYEHSVPFSHRSGERIEPLISLQWFCRMDELAAPAIEVVERDEVRITPEQHKRVYLDWMNNIRPWCVSRQLWWGHRIPVWYGPDGEEIVAETPERARELAAERGLDPDGLTQDPDVLDTWFSSGLWPFATLGWPDEPAPLLDSFYPTDTLVTARDILFLWVARMVMMGIEFAGERPFRRRLHHPDHPGARRTPDVEVARHRDRPPRRDRCPRRRRAALRPPGHGLDAGRALLGGPDPAGPRPGEQDVERLAADPAEHTHPGRAGASSCAGGARARAQDGQGRGPLDRLAAAARGRRLRRGPRRLRLRPRRARLLLVLLVGVLRLVPGDRQAEALRRGCGRGREPAVRARAAACARPPGDALRDRGDLELPPRPARPAAGRASSRGPTSPSSIPRPRTRSGGRSS